MPVNNREQLKRVVDKTVMEARITDVHTHLYPGNFNGQLLWGVDELLTYHYLVAETLRIVPMGYDEFWRLDKTAQADLVWKTLFLENSPYSEACRGVLTALDKLGLPVAERDLDAFREFFRGLTVDQYVDMVFDIAGIDSIVMTNDPFDDVERQAWEQSGSRDERFLAALRIDELLLNWDRTWSRLKDFGYQTEAELTDRTLSEVARFLRDWVSKTDAVYMAVSLPPDFKFPDNSTRGRLIEYCVLPVCRELSIPFAMMIGVKKLVNPGLQLAGDSVGKGDIDTVEYLCANYPNNKFMITMLSRENQHELCVAARKFRNLMIFGCWWFLNNPSLIEEITRMRFELLGVSVVPQHSDARVLDQLIYKWAHSRRIIADVLFDKYSDLMDTGWQISQQEIDRDVANLFGGNFLRFAKKA